MSKSLTEQAKEFGPKEETHVYYFGKTAEPVDDGINSLARLTVKVDEKGNESSYYSIRKCEGDLYDPYGVRLMTKTTLEIFPYRKVDKPVFDLYFKYLKERKSIHLTQARRLDVNNRR